MKTQQHSASAVVSIHFWQSREVSLRYFEQLDTKEALPLQGGSPGLSWTPFLDFEPQLVLPEDSGVLIKGKK